MIDEGVVFRRGVPDWMLVRRLDNPLAFAAAPIVAMTVSSSHSTSFPVSELEGCNQASLSCALLPTLPETLFLALATTAAPPTGPIFPGVVLDLVTADSSPSTAAAPSGWPLRESKEVATPSSSVSSEEESATCEA